MTNKLNQKAVDIAINIYLSQLVEIIKMPSIFKRIFATCWLLTHEDAMLQYLERIELIINIEFE